MGASLKALAQLVGGTVVGDPQVVVEGAAPLVQAGRADITLVDRSAKAEVMSDCVARAAVVPRDFALRALTIPVIQVADIHEAFIKIVNYFRPTRAATRKGISSQALISPSAVLAEDVDVHAGAVIGDDVRIGRGSTIYGGVHIMPGCKLAENVIIYPNAVLYENTVVGARSTIHAGVVLGCHGFGYKLIEGRHERSAQLGYVLIGADVEIGACTTIDRGTYGATVVGDGTKIDNLVMVAHNCRIGRHNMICSQVGIAGSSSTGDYVVMAGQVGVRDHVHVGSGAVLGAMSGITHDVPDGMCMMGIPATEDREQKIKQAALTKLPELRRQLKQLQHTVDALAAAAGIKPSAAA